MDPNACLKELLKSLIELNDGNDSDDRDDVLMHLEALRGWLREGGFAPDAQEVIDELAEF